MDAIVNLAPTGMIPTKAMTPHVPLTPEEIAADVLACADLGITTAHLHARDESGDPTYRKDVYARIIGLIRDRRDDLVLCVSCSGRNWPELEKRAEVLELDGDLKPDMASLTLSSLNFATSASLNAPETVQGLAERMRDRGIRPELEIFDLGMANYAKYLLRKGMLAGPLYANLFFGNIASAQPTLLELGLMIEALPPDTVWAAAGLGEAQLPMNAIALAYGGGVRVGIEDNIWFDRGRSRLATNVELVGRIHEIGRVNGRPVMTPAAFRELMLQDRGAGG
jgi:uncharacterized protein (DUF849 family)